MITPPTIPQPRRHHPDSIGLGPGRRSDRLPGPIRAFALGWPDRQPRRRGTASATIRKPRRSATTFTLVVAATSPSWASSCTSATPVIPGLVNRPLHPGQLHVHPAGDPRRCPGGLLQAQEEKPWGYGYRKHPVVQALLDELGEPLPVQYAGCCPATRSPMTQGWGDQGAAWTTRSRRGHRGASCGHTEPTTVIDPVRTNEARESVPPWAPATHPRFE